MGEETPQKEQLDNLYDEIAIAVLDDTSPNYAAFDVPYSNKELGEEICRIMEWEEFDLLIHHDFEAIYISGGLPQLRAYAYLAHLQFEVALTAMGNNIGDPALNQQLHAYCEYWFLKLRDRIRSLVFNTVTNHPWIH